MEGILSKESFAQNGGFYAPQGYKVSHVPPAMPEVLDFRLESCALRHLF
jgi:hypothetical protein